MVGLFLLEQFGPMGERGVVGNPRGLIQWKSPKFF